MVDGARRELDRERDRALFAELVAVQAQREARRAARLEIAPCLGSVERSSFEEHVRSLGELRRARQHLRQREVEIAVCVALELGRHCVRAEPRRDAAGGSHGTQRRELRVPVEPVTRFSLEGRGSLREHPAAVALDRST